jgi:hypothetical protein
VTKAALLDVLRGVPMNAEVMFVEPCLRPAHGWDKEHEIKAAFSVTGRNGLVVLLTEGPTPNDYDDVESVA